MSTEPKKVPQPKSEAKPTEVPPQTSPVKPVESKADKFRRLAMARVPKVLAAINNLRGLSVRSNYDYTDHQIAKIKVAIDTTLTDLWKAFQGRTESTPEFTL